MKRCMIVLVALVGCATSSGGKAAGALANAAIASGVGAARVASGDCFTICAPGTECNPKTKLCDPIPCRGLCSSNQICDTSGPIEHCASAPGLQVNEKHDVNADQKLPVGITPPLSSAPSSTPEHPDVPAAGR